MDGHDASHRLLTDSGVTSQLSQADSPTSIQEMATTLHFRNYAPKDRSLREEFMLSPPTAEHLEKQIDAHAAQILEQADQQSILSQVLPNRPNWDLKRNVEKRLKLLAHRTDLAIYELIRLKLKGEGGSGTKREDAGEASSSKETPRTESSSRKVKKEEQNLSTSSTRIKEEQNLDEDTPEDELKAGRYELLSKTLDDFERVEEEGLESAESDIY